MSRRFFDYDDGDFAMSISDNMAMDSDGDLTDFQNLYRKNVPDHCT